MLSSVITKAHMLQTQVKIPKVCKLKDKAIVFGTRERKAGRIQARIADLPKSLAMRTILFCKHPCFAIDLWGPRPHAEGPGEGGRPRREGRRRRGTRRGDRLGGDINWEEEKGK